MLPSHHRCACLWWLAPWSDTCLEPTAGSTHGSTNEDHTPCSHNTWQVTAKYLWQLHVVGNAWREESIRTMPMNEWYWRTMICGIFAILTNFILTTHAWQVKVTYLAQKNNCRRGICWIILVCIPTNLSGLWTARNTVEYGENRHTYSVALRMATVPQVRWPPCTKFNIVCHHIRMLHGSVRRPLHISCDYCKKPCRQSR